MKPDRDRINEIAEKLEELNTLPSAHEGLNDKIRVMEGLKKVL